MKASIVNRILFKNPEHQVFFDVNGYVVVDFLNDREITSLKKFYDSLEGDLGEPAFASTIMSKSAIYRNAVSKGIGNHFERAMATIFEEVTFFWGNFNIKYPHQNIGMVPLHQDPSFLDERRFQPLGLWVPLIDTNIENGALEVIPGSHHFLDFPRCGGAAFPFSKYQEALLKEFGISLPMKAGQIYIGNPALFHASPTNKSLHPRIAAAGLAGPSESSLRYHCYNESGANNSVDIFEVDRKYYLSAPLFSRPNVKEYEIVESLVLEKQKVTKEILFDYLNQFKIKKDHVTC
ncbi:phytanoyl-CoA dioxygenase family protein [Flavobacterium procerum]|uniref:Phytanoyl-CoA dioxygenase family protein n=1 Tax=Flavobacterium procerum TaxID=1455569 RepID=A0ABV6BRZ5_9FLAO